MGFFDKYKRNYSIRKITKEYNTGRRIAVACNLADAKSIGIIYNVANIENLDTVKNFINSLESNFKEILVLGYINEKKSNESEADHHEFTFFNKKDINWYNKPVGAKALGFIDKEFDILIDFDFGYTLPIKYAIVKSKAKFKVGKINNNYPNFLDLSLAIDLDKDTTGYFIEQLKIYLSMIKTS